jgi:hypothetical protein
LLRARLQTGPGFSCDHFLATLSVSPGAHWDPWFQLMVAVTEGSVGLLAALDRLPTAFTYPDRLLILSASVLASGLILFR